MLLSASIAIVGLLLLLGHRRLTDAMHEAEGHSSRLGGRSRVQAIVLLSGVAFFLAGILSLTGVLSPEE